MEVAVDQRRAADLERREQLARERDQLAALVAFALAAVDPAGHVVADPAERLARRPPQPARDVDGDRDRLLLRQRREVVARAARALRAARAASGRCAAAERRRRRPRARATRPRAATRRHRPRRPSAPRRRRPARRTSTARARTARRARAPHSRATASAIDFICSRSGSSSICGTIEGAEAAAPRPPAGEGSWTEQSETLTNASSSRMILRSPLRRTRPAANGATVTRSEPLRRPNQAPLWPSHRAGARAPAGRGAGSGRRARADRARAPRRRRALGLGDGRAGVRRASAAQGGAASRARRAALGRADRPTGADRDAQDARCDAHRRRPDRRR